MEPLRPQMHSVRTRSIAVPLGLCAGGVAALATAVVLIVTQPLAPAPAPVITAVPVMVPAPPAPAPPPTVPAEEPPPTDEPAPLRVVRGTCSLGMVPPALRQPLTAAQQAEMDELIANWLADPTFWRDRPSIDYRRGVVFVEGEEDRGDDPPYPRSAGPEATRVCGSAGAWLRSHLQQRLADKARADGGGLTCQDNVCCYTGEMEYAPSGLIVFRAPGADDDRYSWKLDAWAVYASTGLSADYAEANAHHVVTSLRRLASGTCPGEPAGAD